MISGYLPIKNKYLMLKDQRSPPPHDSRIDLLPNIYMWTLSRTELIKRLNSKQCEYCGTTQGTFEVHHIRKLKDVAAYDGSTTEKNPCTLYPMSSPASQWHTPRKRSSQVTSKGRAVCGDKSQARFGEGGTGDPVMGDRPLLYPTPGEVALDHHLLTSLFLPEDEISTKPWQVNNNIDYNQGGDIVARGKKGKSGY
jgi:hypothetical protein